MKAQRISKLFELPEMEKLKTLSSRLQRDIIFISIFLIYIYVDESITSLNNNSINYKNYIIPIIALFITFIAYF
jgi:hypothetical protein